MKIFLTGAFGSIGCFTLEELLKRDYDVVCYDIRTKKNMKSWKRLSKKGFFKTIWGDISDPEAVSNAMENVDCILHVAAIIPPISERIPEVAMDVNVGGTRNIIESAKKKENSPKIVYVSSVTVHGPRMHIDPPVRANHDLKPTTVYTNSKVEAEKIVRESGLRWIIIRPGVVPPVDGGMNFFDESWKIPIKQRMEFIHPKDVGLALANAVSVDMDGKILMLGGGNDCQFTCGEFFRKIFSTLGIKMFPDSAFKNPKPPNEAPDEWYFTDWMDTEEAQKILQFQNHCLEDYLEDLKKRLGISIYLAKIFSPLVHRMLLKRSPYFPKNLRS